MNNETFNLFISRYEIIKRFFSLFDFNEDDPSESFGLQCKVIGDDLASRNVIGVTHEAIQTYFDEEEKSFLIAFLVKSQYADFKICRDSLGCIISIILFVTSNEYDNKCIDTVYTSQPSTGMDIMKSFCMQLKVLFEGHTQPTSNESVVQITTEITTEPVVQITSAIHLLEDNKDGSIGNRYSLTNFKLIHLLTYLLS